MIDYKKIELDIFNHFKALKFEGCDEVDDLFSTRTPLSFSKLKDLESKIGFQFPTMLKDFYLNYSNGIYFFGPYDSRYDVSFNFYFLKAEELVEAYLENVERYKDFFGPQAEYWLPLREHEGNGDTVHIDCSRKEHPIILATIAEETFDLDENFESFYKNSASVCF